MNLAPLQPLIVVFSVIAFSFGCVCQKILFESLPTHMTVFVHNLFHLCMLLLLGIQFEVIPPKSKRKQVLILGILGAGGHIANQVAIFVLDHIAYFTCCAALLNFYNPLLGARFLNENLQGCVYYPCAVLTVAAIIVSIFPFYETIGPNDVYGIIISIICVLLVGPYLLLCRKWNPSPIPVSIATRLIALIILPFVSLLKHEQIVIPSLEQFGLLLLVALCLCVGMLLRIVGFALNPLPVATLIVNLQVALDFHLQLAFFKKPISIVQYISISILIAAASMYQFLKQDEKRGEEGENDDVENKPEG